MAVKQMVAAAIGCALMAFGSTGAASAQEAYGYSQNGPGFGGPGRHDLRFFELHYADNVVEQGLSGRIRFHPEVVRERNDGKIGGFWLVLSDGPNPKNQIGEYAILYADLRHNRITAYEYNGDNNASSYNDPGNFLQTFDNAFTATPGNANEINFQLNVTSINAQNLGSEWDGVSFGPDRIGVWFHFSRDLEVQYRRKNGNLEITNFQLNRQGYVDFANRHVTDKDCADLPADFPGCGEPPQVSEPATFGLLGLGLIGLAAHRRRARA